MNFYSGYLVATIVPLIFFSSPPRLQTNRYELSGIITQKESGKPMSNIYLYAIKGEEEAMTDKNGAFKFTTWQKLPIHVFIRHNDTQLRIVVSNPAEVLKIKL